MKCPFCRSAKVRTRRTTQATDVSTVREHVCQACKATWPTIARIPDATLEAALKARRKAAKEARRACA